MLNSHHLRIVAFGSGCPFALPIYVQDDGKGIAQTVRTILNQRRDPSATPYHYQTLVAAAHRYCRPRRPTD